MEQKTLNGNGKIDAVSLKEAKKIISNINKDHEKIIQIKANCDELWKEISQRNIKSRRIEAAINEINQTTDKIYSELNERKDDINKKYHDISSFHDRKFTPLIKKIEDPESGIGVKVQKTNSLFHQIEQDSNSISKKLQEISKQTDEYRRIVGSLKNLEISTNTVFKSISDKKPKIDDLYKRISEIEKNAKISLTEITSIFKDSKRRFEDIESLKAQSGENFIEIQSNKDQSDDLLKRIQEIYDIAAETGLSGDFEKRRNNLKLDVQKWETRIFRVALILLCSLVVLFIFQLCLYDWDITKHNFDMNFYVRFLILSPIVYYLVFCSNQYEKTKKLHDKYAFKTTLAMSIKAHIELLLTNKNFQTPDRINTILEFVISGLNKIYKEPYSSDDYKFRLKLANSELEIENRVLDKIMRNLKKEN